MPRQSELFHTAPATKTTAAHAPLAERMRPRIIDEFVGQQHLIGPGHVLRDMVESGRVESLILWGPPGSGKTTLAYLLAAASGAPAVAFSAVLQGVKELRHIVDEAELTLARTGRSTVLFVDEIHRFNKAQQDAFLPHVEAAQQRALRYDKAGEEHYNVISAFIKSLRGGDPDAAVYWMMRMLEAGEDPLFVARRMVIFAAEDVGNAEPQALQVAVAAKDAVHFVGLPEGRIPLAQAATFLATCPKSNASYRAMLAAAEDVRQVGPLPVPLHLRNAPTPLMKGLGYGAGYLYPHDYEDAVVEQDYLPERLRARRYYEPSDRGREREIGEHLRAWRARRARTGKTPPR